MPLNFNQRRLHSHSKRQLNALSVIRLHTPYHTPTRRYKISVDCDMIYETVPTMVMLRLSHISVVNVSKNSKYDVVESRNYFWNNRCAYRSAFLLFEPFEASRCLVGIGPKLISARPGIWSSHESGAVTRISMKLHFPALRSPCRLFGALFRNKCISTWALTARIQTYLVPGIQHRQKKRSLMQPSEIIESESPSNFAGNERSGKRPWWISFHRWALNGHDAFYRSFYRSRPATSHHSRRWRAIISNHVWFSLSIPHVFRSSYDQS